MEYSYLLTQRWERAWQKLKAREAPQGILVELIEAYSSADRFYHTLDHIVDCLSLFDETKFLAAHPEEVELAIWFHDAIYDTHRNDNEQKSAQWAASVIHQSGLSRALAERVSTSILATRHSAEVTATDAQLMVDVDLSILGREAKTYWQYEENIRKEYAWVSESLFRQTRIEILRGFLNRQHIYYHEVYRKMFEEKARLNLNQAIASLSGTSKSV